MSQKLIDVSKLNQTLITYDKALRALPFATLQEVAAKLGLNVMDLQGKHALINERRRAGGTQSYKIGKNFRLVDKRSAMNLPLSNRRMLYVSQRKTLKNTMTVNC
ncbi:hypothetical protein NXX21_22235 [Bacteroides thetaiotaomicron]|uniref:hypothetical protein n=1 Tax=Bacteroides thetaiotaomicron TaxID=818 RepID=UPI002165BC23|nr:hypothetical protein [Bacteroides thetaiotaomicron]MCS2911423.1 hypothetical protein [Bacteroides thetaiotaomicron]